MNDALGWFAALASPVLWLWLLLRVSNSRLHVSKRHKNELLSIKSTRTRRCIDRSTHFTPIMAQQPDLQAILATLAQYSQQSASSATPPPAPQSTATNSFATTPATEENSQATSHNAIIESVPADPRLRGRPQSRSTTPFQTQHAPPQSPSVIDPATITVWQDGLRCVTKIASQNKMFEASIRKVSCFCCWFNRRMSPLTSLHFR